jgi:hypothetical protein
VSPYPFYAVFASARVSPVADLVLMFLGSLALLSWFLGWSWVVVGSSLLFSAHVPVVGCSSGVLRLLLFGFC